MISLSDARAAIVRELTPLHTVRVAIADARGRILREPLTAPADLPVFDRSAMDGFALGPGVGASYRVVLEIQAGTVPTRALGDGECARVFTGAQIPAGTVRVLMQEHARREGDTLIPLRTDGPVHIRRRGEDARAGDTLLAAGTRLGACELSLLAHVGATTPFVSAPVRVLHIATGAELVAPESMPAAGHIRDTNSTMIAALLAERGATLSAQARCGDDLDEILRLTRASDDWDLLLISGGASVGDYDFGARSLAALGFTIHFDRLNLRPGKPLIFATRGAQAAFILPGNPVSHFVTFHLAVRLAIECLENATPSWSLVSVTMATELPAQADARETFWPCALRAENGGLVAEPLAWKSSGDLCGLASARGLLHLPPGSGVDGCLLLDLA